MDRVNNRVTYIAVAIAITALIIAIMTFVYRPPAQAGQAQVIVNYKLNPKLQNETTIEYNAAAYPFYPVLAGKEPLLWFNATVRNADYAIVEVLITVNGEQISQKYVVKGSLVNQPVYVDLRPYIEGTKTLKISVHFVGYT